MCVDKMEEPQVRLRMPKNGEMLGIVLANVGSNKLQVRCQDSKMRLCRIPGKLRKRIWIRENDIIIMKPWDIQGDIRGDVVWRYSPAQSESLRRKGILDM